MLCLYGLNRPPGFPGRIAWSTQRGREPFGKGTNRPYFTSIAFWTAENCSEGTFIRMK